MKKKKREIKGGGGKEKNRHRKGKDNLCIRKQKWQYIFETFKRHGKAFKWNIMHQTADLGDLRLPAGVRRGHRPQGKSQLKKVPFFQKFS